MCECVRETHTRMCWYVVVHYGLIAHRTPHTAHKYYVAHHGEHYAMSSALKCRASREARSVQLCIHVLCGQSRPP